MLETFTDLDLHLFLTLTYICITEVRLMTLMNLPRAKQREKDCAGRPTTQESGKYWKYHNNWTAGPKITKLFSCSTQLRLKSKLLIDIKIAKMDGIFRFKSPI